MTTSVYLAKSNRANPDHVTAVRELLSRFDVEIVEYKGGGYSHKPLLQCDMLIVVPDLSDDEEENEEWVSVGKGLFEQINAFKNNGHFNKCDLMIVNYYHAGTKGLGLGSFDCLEPCDSDDYVNYADILFNTDKSESLGSLNQILENRFGFETSTNVSSKSRYRYLLIGRKK